MTSTWCSLSALAVVSYLSVDLHFTVCTRLRRSQHAPSTCTTPEVASGRQAGQPLSRSDECTSNSGSKDCANTLLFFLFTVTLLIATLPLAGYGPKVMLANSTCDSWLVSTPSSGRQRTYFVAFLAFGFLNLLTVVVAVGGATFVLRAVLRRAERPGEQRYTDESGGHRNNVPPLDHGSVSHCYKMTGLILVNQTMWIPTLVSERSIKQTPIQSKQAVRVQPS